MVTKFVLLNFKPHAEVYMHHTLPTRLLLHGIPPHHFVLEMSFESSKEVTTTPQIYPNSSVSEVLYILFLISCLPPTRTTKD